jgi:hypothetical protein
MRGGRNGLLSSHLPWADPRRGWDFISTGHGDTDWESIFRMLNSIDYSGPISIEWEDAGMDRLDGAPEALKFIRTHNAIRPPPPRSTTRLPPEPDRRTVQALRASTVRKGSLRIHVWGLSVLSGQPVRRVVDVGCPCPR